MEFSMFGCSQSVNSTKLTPQMSQKRKNQVLLNESRVTQFFCLTYATVRARFVSAF